MSAVRFDASESTRCKQFVGVNDERKLRTNARRPRTDNRKPQHNAGKQRNKHPMVVLEHRDKVNPNGGAGSRPGRSFHQEARHADDVDREVNAKHPRPRKIPLSMSIIESPVIASL